MRCAGLKNSRERNDRTPPKNLSCDAWRNGNNQLWASLFPLQEKTILCFPWKRGRTCNRLQSPQERGGDFSRRSPFFQDALYAPQRMDFSSRSGKAGLEGNRRIGAIELRNDSESTAGAQERLTLSQYSDDVVRCDH